MVRKAFKLAQTERPGSVYLGVPEDVEAAFVPDQLMPLEVNIAPYRRALAHPDCPSGCGARRRASDPSFWPGTGPPAPEPPAHSCISPSCWVSRWRPRFTARACSPTITPMSLGAVGFMSHDYVNFGFDEADVIVSVGYELQEFDPVRINPGADKQIIHLSRVPAEVDAHYVVEVGIQADISSTLAALGEATDRRFDRGTRAEKIQRLLAGELAEGAADDSFPLKPQRVVADTRAALGRSDIVLADTGAVKMWMARLYPTFEPNTCLISNGLSTMAFALPGAIGAKLAMPDRKVLAAVGDGAFLMNSQELETALREKVPMTVLIWEDDAYGLISWKMDLELGHHVEVGFSNPDFVAYAESFGAKRLPGRCRGRSPADADQRPWRPTRCR